MYVIALRLLTRDRPQATKYSGLERASGLKLGEQEVSIHVGITRDVYAFVSRIIDELIESNLPHP